MLTHGKRDHIDKTHNSATQYTNEIDNLRKLLESSYIDEGLPYEHADKFSTKEANRVMQYLKQENSL